MDINRIYRLLRIVRSRFADFSKLRTISSASESVDWYRTNGMSMLNGSVIRAKIIQEIFDLAKCNIFIETGTYHGATAIGINRFLQAPVWSCESNSLEYFISRFFTVGMGGVRLYRQDSRCFLKMAVSKLGKMQSVPFFYLDAHEGRFDRNSLPLLEEIKILSAMAEFVVVIDDFCVPHDKGFGYGTYGDHVVGIDLVYDTLIESKIQSCFFPAYTSSTETGVTRGFCMFWRSGTLDRAVKGELFPFNLIRAFKL